MNRIYCDSNIFRIIKPTHPKFNPDLLRTLTDLKDRFLFIFSDAHLDDLKDSSIKEKTDNDLIVIGEYCRDNYFSFDHVKGKSLQLLLASPLKAFYNRNYKAVADFFTKPFNIDSVFDGFEDSPYLSVIKMLMQNYFNLPISMFGSIVDLSTLDSKTKDMFNKAIPSYSPEMNITDLLNYGANLLKNEKDFTELRKFSASYLNSDSYSYKNWGLAFDRKLQDSVFGKSYLDHIDSIIVDGQKKDPYYRFTLAYGLLETYGIVQERDGKKIKKFTYDSMNRDASHAFFASYCDYLVTDDKGLQVKAHILYKLLGIKTEILSSDDFVNRRGLLLANEETYESFFESINFDVNHSMLVAEHTSLINNQNLREYKTTHPYFNYFNHYQVLDHSEVTLAFLCRRKNRGNFFLHREIELLIVKLSKTFGTDDFNKGFFDMAESELLKDGEPIRSWTINNVRFDLMTSSLSSGNYIVLLMRFLALS